MITRCERGSCFCGAIAAEMMGEPFWIIYDHDDDCRKAIGAPLTIWVGYRTEKVRFVQGVPKAFSRTPGVMRTFCAECGSSIGYRDDGLGGETWLTIGFLDFPERFAPEAHGYWRLRLPWIMLADDLPRFETYTRERDPVLGTPRER
jgi:hypothetical protein